LSWKTGEKDYFRWEGTTAIYPDLLQLFIFLSLFEKLASCPQVPLNTAKSRADEWQVKLLYIFYFYSQCSGSVTF
jgi:hypothetical protein